MTGTYQAANDGFWLAADDGLPDVEEDTGAGILSPSAPVAKRCAGVDVVGVQEDEAHILSCYGQHRGNGRECFRSAYVGSAVGRGRRPEHELVFVGRGDHLSFDLFPRDQVGGFYFLQYRGIDGVEVGV